MRLWPLCLERTFLGKRIRNLRPHQRAQKTKPTATTEKEAGVILQQVQEGVEKPRGKSAFVAGELVRIVDGPFMDFNGTVEDVNYEKSKLRVSVSIFGRLTPVELEFSQVEKA